MSEETQSQPEATTPEPVQQPDVFALDENALVSLSPEQRASLEPVIDSWKKKAIDEIGRREKEAGTKYKPLEEKASALDKLTNYQPFIQWWAEHQKSGQSKNAQTPPPNPQLQAAWSEAVLEAAQGDPTKIQNLQAQMMAQGLGPFLNQLQEWKKGIDTDRELRDLFSNHTDAKELDQIGIDPKTKEGISILEMGLDWAEKNGKPLEEGYALARKWADSMKVGAQQEAMGMVEEKKKSVTASQSTSSASGTVVPVDDVDSLIRQALASEAKGQKDVLYTLK